MDVQDSAPRTVGQTLGKVFSMESTGFGSAFGSGFPTAKPQDVVQGFTLGKRPINNQLMADYSKRLETFKEYSPRPFHPRASELAALGFFYLGNGDKVQCFCCGICIHDWQASDMVLNEHARWSLGKCNFLRHITSFNY
jgi:hypothetical protein